MVGGWGDGKTRNVRERRHPKGDEATKIYYFITRIINNKIINNSIVIYIILLKINYVYSSNKHRDIKNVIYISNTSTIATTLRLQLRRSGVVTGMV